MDSYSLEKNYLRTDGRDVCHWCALRPQEWVWGPYGTRMCDYCDQLATSGKAGEIVEEIDARITVRVGWLGGINPDRWRKNEAGRLARWLEVRTTRVAIQADHNDD